MSLDAEFILAIMNKDSHSDVKLVVEPQPSSSNTHTEEEELEQFKSEFLQQARNSDYLMSVETVTKAITLRRTAPLILGYLIIEAKKAKIPGIQMWWDQVKREDKKARLVESYSNAALRFEEGSEKELAEYIQRRLETAVSGAGEILPDENSERKHLLRFAQGEFWRYGLPEAGIWNKMNVREDIKDPLYEVHGAKFETTDEQGAKKVLEVRMTDKFAHNIIESLKTFCSAETLFDQPVPGLVMQNCFVRLDDRGDIITEPHSATHLARTKLDVPYLGSGRCPKLLLSSLEACFRDDPDKADKIELYRQFFGTCLLERGARPNQMFLFLGEGENGKSMACRVADALFPGKLRSKLTPKAMEDGTMLAALEHAKLNMVTDMEPDELLKTGIIKTISEGEPLAYRVIYGTDRTLNAKAGHLFSLNRLPPINEFVHGFSRRWGIITFNRKIPEAERVDGFYKQIVAEELDIIAAWFIDGASRVAKNKNRYVQPQSSKDAVTCWMEEMNPVAMFLRMCCRQDPARTEDGKSIKANWTQATVLFKNFEIWRERNNYHKLTATTFGSRLKSLGIEWKKLHGGVILYAVKCVGETVLKDLPDDDPVVVH